MSESLDAFLNRTVNPFAPLQVGDLTVGWVGPRFSQSDEEEDEDRSRWAVVLRDHVFDLSFSLFVARCERLRLNVPRNVKLVMRFDADLFLYLPEKAIDFWSDPDEGEGSVRVDYTDRTILHLHASLTDYVRALQDDVQSRLNKQDLEEAAKTYARLLGADYPYATDLKWRGEPAIIVLNTPLQKFIKELKLAKDESLLEKGE